MAGDLIAQAGVTIFGVTAIYLVGLKDKKKARWGYLVGIFSQPFWAYTFISHDQWIMLPLCLLYGGSWIIGLRNNWHYEL